VPFTSQVKKSQLTTEAMLIAFYHMHAQEHLADPAPSPSGEVFVALDLLILDAIKEGKATFNPETDEVTLEAMPEELRSALEEA
jgi:hypothetical protein